MLKRLIRQIRQKPKGVRDNIALGTAGVFTFLVFTVWLYHAPSRFTSEASLSRDDGTAGFTQIFDTLQEQVANVKESVSAATEASPEEPIPSNPLQAQIDRALTEHNAQSMSGSSTAQIRSANELEPAPETAEESASATIDTKAVEAASGAPRTVRIVTTSSSSEPTESSENP
ncbi:hypothetical protein H6778_00125 [Candidatus Nomurabacteria bacterium]|nr:hypothetical protein [Candidatus Nomurabacteria bacterium]